MVTAKQLFDDFVFYLAYTASWQNKKKEQPYLKALGPTPDRLALFEELIRWCSSQGVPPRPWLFSLFGTRRWLFGPQLKSTFLCSKKHLPRFKTFSDYTFYRSRLRAEQDLQALFDPNRDVNTAAEEAKAKYLEINNPEICMRQMSEETFGYHPKSGKCQTCREKGQCLERLRAICDFDVLALRVGKITSEEARTQALARTQSYGR